MKKDNGLEVRFVKRLGRAWAWDVQSRYEYWAGQQGFSNLAPKLNELMSNPVLCGPRFG